MITFAECVDTIKFIKQQIEKNKGEKAGKRLAKQRDGAGEGERGSVRERERVAERIDRNRMVMEFYDGNDGYSLCILFASHLNCNLVLWPCG